MKRWCVVVIVWINYQKKIYLSNNGTCPILRFKITSKNRTSAVLPLQSIWNMFKSNWCCHPSQKKNMITKSCLSSNDLNLHSRWNRETAQTYKSLAHYKQEVNLYIWSNNQLYYLLLLRYDMIWLKYDMIYI